MAEYEQHKQMYEGQGLRAPAWVIAGGQIVQALQNGGGLGGILGGGQQTAQMVAASNENSSLKAQIAKLEAEKYTDAQVSNLYAAKVRDDKELAAFANSIDKRVAAIETAIPLQAQIFDGKIAQAAQAAECCCKAANAAIASLQAQVGAITKLVIPNNAVCSCLGSVTTTPSGSAAAG